ncbi:MAG: hypothetical protein KA419_10405 [Acidobacteria bacterium]|nr:hypothetical protein [Acidobacteriota bacterium]
MNNERNRNKAGTIGSKWSLLFALTALTCSVGAAAAADFNLRADTTQATMPDGRVVPLWGFALDSAPGAGDGTVTVPGPELRIDPRDPFLRIRLENRLPVPVSLVIPGQAIPETYKIRGPFAQTQVNPLRNTDGRVRSFSAEVEPGSFLYFVWHDPKPGTFLYQSGSHPAVQVQMGLYGALRIDAARTSAPEAYPGHAYDREVFLVVSELDPFLHDSVSLGEYGAGKQRSSTVDYHPMYFLVNGKPFGPGRRPIAAGDPGGRLLLRLVNAGIDDHVLMFPGLSLSWRAEDGELYPWPKAVSAVMLPAGKTADVWTSLPDSGYFPVWDRRLSLTNGPRAQGGMLVYLQAGLARVPLALEKTGTGSGTLRVASLPGGPACRDACTEVYLYGTTLTLVAEPDNNSVFTGWSGIEPDPGTDTTITVTLNAATALSARFDPKGEVE